MPIFLGDITYNPLQGPAPKHGPTADWTWPHGAPRPTPCPAKSAAQPPWTSGRTGPLRYPQFCFNPPLACGGVKRPP